PAQYLCTEAHQEFNELTHTCKSSVWQYDAVQQLHACINLIHPEIERLGSKVEARKWFSLFALLRNKTRGHGAELSTVHSQIVPDLEASIRLWTENFALFARPWAYLHQNLSGKHRVTRLSR